MDYSQFLLGMIGKNGEKKYLLMLENNTELRPGGGFPGSYALITFRDGALQNIVFDDIYNIDGQMKEKIVPPIPLQHITPTWGMRDANWFPDFPTSAKKIEEMYKKEGGKDVDGIIAMTPDFILDILRITGPIPMPEYSLVLNADNFMEQVQAEVEYGDNRTQPKSVLKDFLPKFMSVLQTQSKETWFTIFETAMKHMQQKNIVAYFDDSTLEHFVNEHNISGALVGPAGDYLSVVFSNVMGSKTDAFTKNVMRLRTEMSGDKSILDHTLAITRTHQGGDLTHNFYNRPNPDYVRVYLPKNATFVGIEGQSITAFKPLVSYNDTTYTNDPDVLSIESHTTHPVPGVDIFEESGKKVVGFWIVLKPQQSQTVNVRYTVPNENQTGYHLTWQKQIGLMNTSFAFTFPLAQNAKMITTDPTTIQDSNLVTRSGDFLNDQEIGFRIQ
jgi:hypothetical protein